MLSPSPFSSPSPAPASLITRRAFLRRGAFSASLLLSTPAWAASSSTDGTSLSNDDLLARAQDRIEKCRQGDGRVIVVDSKGRPVRDVKVRLQQVRHDFLFGCNLFNWGRCGDPDREAQYRQRFADLLNFATLGFYWRTIRTPPRRTQLRLH